MKSKLDGTVQEIPTPPGWLGAHGQILWSIALVTLASAWYLELDFGELLPGPRGWALAGKFFSHALAPALEYEAAVPSGTTPLLLKALEAAGVTVVFAAAAMSLAVVGGLLLGFLASTAWWADATLQEKVGGGNFGLRSIGPSVFFTVRLCIGVMRSIHELLWAVLFLAAFGLGQMTAVLAIAIPFTGTLAKIYSEMIDEAPRRAGLAAQNLGATPTQIYFFCLLPQALPDMAAYSFYRFECALRSSAIMGFFGFPTLGYYISASFENLHYAEVWTYIYILIFLVVVGDFGSGVLRRSLNG